MNAHFIGASAGSGKTYRLSTHYIGLLLRTPTVDPGSILAATFTRAAAGEILVRVLKRLAESVLDRSIRDRLASDLGRSEGLSAAECSAALERLTDSMHRVSIGTIDSFFARLARALPDLFDVPRNYRVCSDTEDAEVCAEVLRELISGPQSDAVRKAWAAWRGETARSRNLDAMLELVADLRFRTAPKWVAEPPRPITGARLSPEDADRWRSVVSSLPCAKNANGKENVHFRKGIDGFLRNLTPGSRIEDLVLDTKILCHLVSNGDLPGAGGDRVVTPPEWAVALAPLIDQVRRTLNALHNERVRGLWGLRDAFAEAREKASRALGSLTFSEVEEFVRRAVCWESPGAAEDVYFHLDSRIEHILFDEFQDTSWSQFEFFKPVIEEVLATADRSLFVVGDPKQAIYGWRGGDREIIDRLPSWFGEGRFIEEQLSVSYRSSPAVLEAVDAVFEGMGSVSDSEIRHPFSDAAAAWAKGYAGHKAHHTQLRGEARLWCLPKDGTSETAFIVGRVLRLLEPPDAPREVAVLLRRRVQIPAIIDALRREGVDVASGAGGNLITDSAAVEVLLAGLTFLDHPHTRSAAARLASQAPWAETLGQEGFGAEAASRAWLDQWGEVWENEGATGILTEWMADADFAARLSAHDQRRCRQLLGLARRFDRSGGGRPGDFVHSARAETVKSGRPARVVVMTIHASKGLEFEAVVLGDLGERGRPPQGPPLLRDPETGEEHCLNRSRELALCAGRRAEWERREVRGMMEKLSLLYVGMTRARSFLDIVVTVVSSSPCSFQNAALLPRVLAPGVLPSESTPVWKTESTGLPWSELRVGGRAPAPADTAFVPIDDSSHLPSGALARPIASHVSARLERKSPSGEEGGSTRVFRQMFPSIGRKGLSVGTAVHAWLACVEWKPDVFASAEIDRILEETAPDWAGIERPEARDMLADLLGRIAEPNTDLADAFDRSIWAARFAAAPSSLEVWRERAFSVPRGDSLWSGRFDRVVVSRNEDDEIAHAVIIDFKSDVLGSKEIRRSKEAFYAPQLNAYAEILAHALRHQTVKASVDTLLVFTHPG